MRAPSCALPLGARRRRWRRCKSHLAKAGIAKYKWPEEIRAQQSDFPRTAAGKVRKADLRDVVRGAGS